MLKKGFTLVELMVAVSILSIGIVLVIRSFLTAQTALEASQNRFKAIQFLETKMSEFEEKAKEEEGIQPEEKQEEVNLGNRKATFKSEIVPLEIEELKEDLNEVKLSLLWKESGRDKDEILSAYMENKK